jgi:hypothetical protein
MATASKPVTAPPQEKAVTAPRQENEISRSQSVTASFNGIGANCAARGRSQANFCRRSCSLVSDSGYLVDRSSHPAPGLGRDVISKHSREIGDYVVCRHRLPFDWDCAGFYPYLAVTHGGATDHQMQSSRHSISWITLRAGASQAPPLILQRPRAVRHSPYQQGAFVWFHTARLCEAKLFVQVITMDELTTSVVCIDFPNDDKSMSNRRMECMI